MTVDQSKLSLATLLYPTGLQVTESSVDGSSAREFICLLQHDVVSLRHEYRHVYEISNVLSVENCQEIIRSAEAYSEKTGGWTTARHSAFATTDLPLEAVFGTFSSMHGIVAGTILPHIAERFGLNEDDLKIGELFIAKYEFQPGKQAGLGAHKDGTPWSFVVTLNNPCEFVGGGTRFVEDYAGGVTYRPSTVGSAVIFSGKNKHEGVPITSGCRYILTGFCSYHSREGVSHEAFMSQYREQHDGSAASRGVKTGDIIRGILLDQVAQKKYKDFATTNRRGNIYEDAQSEVKNGDAPGSVLKSEGELDDDVNPQLNDFSGPTHSVLPVRGLPSENVRAAMRFAAGTTGAEVRVIIERGCGEEGSGIGSVGKSRAQLMDHIQRIAPRLLSTGKFWSVDEELECEFTSRLYSI